MGCLLWIFLIVSIFYLHRMFSNVGPYDNDTLFLGPECGNTRCLSYYGKNFSCSVCGRYDEFPREDVCMYPFTYRFEEPKGIENETCKQIEKYCTPGLCKADKAICHEGYGTFVCECHRTRPKYGMYCDIETKNTQNFYIGKCTMTS